MSLYSHHPRLTGAELSRAQLTVMAGAIVLSILVNILLILGQHQSCKRTIGQFPTITGKAATKDLLLVESQRTIKLSGRERECCIYASVQQIAISTTHSTM